MSSEHHQDLAEIEIIHCTPVHANILVGLHGDGACFEISWDTPSFRTLLEMPGGFDFIARLADQPAGFIMARQAQDEDEIIFLGVLPDHRRHGLARTLVRAA
jgi:ribosomal-protein-alanine N-acetyltransferase